MFASVFALWSLFFFFHDWTFIWSQTHKHTRCFLVDSDGKRSPQHEAGWNSKNKRKSFVPETEAAPRSAPVFGLNEAELQEAHRQNFQGPVGFSTNKQAEGKCFKRQHKVFIKRKLQSGNSGFSLWTITIHITYDDK